MTDTKNTEAPPPKCPWISNDKTPLFDVDDEYNYTLHPDYEDLRLFAIRLKDQWEYQLGYMKSDGSICNEIENTGREAWDVDYYINISEPESINRS